MTPTRFALLIATVKILALSQTVSRAASTIEFALSWYSGFEATGVEVHCARTGDPNVAFTVGAAGSYRSTWNGAGLLASSKRFFRVRRQF